MVSGKKRGNMIFNEIIGQEIIINALKNSITGSTVGHAFIFSGPKGIGKKTVAGIFASTLLCENRKGFDACGVCMSCQLRENGTNPDFHIIEPFNPSISVEEIRNLQDGICIKPLYSSRKVYIIYESDRMTLQAQNCLLKTLEEPPAYTVIILTTDNYETLLPTIRSRAVRYDFKKNTHDEVRAFLDREFGGDIKNKDFLVSYCDGVIGKTLEISASFLTVRDALADIIIKLGNRKTADVFEMYDFFEANREDIDLLLNFMVLFYRDFLVLKKTGNENMLINSDKKDIILNNVSAFSTREIVRNIELIEQSRRYLKQNANYQLTVEVMLMKLQEEIF